MSQVYEAGSVIVADKRITLTRFDGNDPLNIYPQVTSFDIYENLDSYTLSADFYLADGIDLINNYPLVGEEQITVALETPGSEIIKFNFLIENIEGLRTNAQANLKSYRLHCSTKDYLKNASMTITKRYRDMKYDQALTSLINEDFAGEIKLKYTESTTGIFDFVVNNKRPFQIVDIIKERACSATNKSSVFVFYQDPDGYHFTTIEQLIKDRKNDAVNKTFHYRTAQRNLDIEENINQWEILSYETLNHGNQVEKTMNGAMRNQIRSFDIFRGTYYEVKEYNNATNHKDFERIDDGEDTNSVSFNEFTEKMPAVSRMVVKDTLRPEMQHNNFIHYQRPYMEKLSQSGLRIRVYGNTQMRVGDVVNLNFPEIAGIDSQKVGQIASSNYLITALKHRCDKDDSNEFNHTMVLELRRPDQHGSAIG